MSKHIVFYTLFFSCFSYTQVKAQQGREKLIPLSVNSLLQEQYNTPKVPEQRSTVSFQKAAILNNRFPFIDRFDDGNIELTDSLWEFKSVKVENERAILNAQNEVGNTYNSGNGSFGETDILQSKDIAILGSNGQLFIAFTYSTGATWQNGDSLVLEFKTPSGNYVSAWKSPNSILSTTTVRIPIVLQNVLSSAFGFRFKSYTTRISTNTQTFLINEIVLSDKLDLPYYENFIQTSFNDTTTPSPLFWQQAEPHLIKEYSPAGTNAVVFNAFSKSGNVYANNGYGDTLHSQPINMLLYPISDSIFVRFLYKSMPAADNTDTLLVDFLNNAGDWISVMKLIPNNSQQFVPYIQQANVGRFRHANFQYRIINKSNYSVTDTLQFLVTGFHVGPKLKLPFVDDFSASNIFPSAKRWKDRTVFINNTFPKLPPTVNVATFDGLDERGNAYGQGTGYLDTLTSKAIYLQSLTRSDSVYLSFQIEPQGFGDLPENTDYLTLEFRTNRLFENQWNEVWFASSQAYSNTKFTEVYILVDSAYLTDDFQFRFRNIGSRTGNIDNWHLDYVRLDRGRTLVDGFFDFAIQQSPPSLLQKYYAMPSKHYLQNPTAYTNTIHTIGLRNNDTIVYPLNFGRKVVDATATQISIFNDVQPGVDAKGFANGAISNSFILTPTLGADSVLFHSTYFTNQNNNFDNIPSNDTLTIPTIFSNYFAYDDGSAEAGYGIEIEPGSVALGYTLETPDTLQGLSMFFNQSTSDVSTQEFNLVIWSAIGTNGNGTGETVIKKIQQARPTYMNELNRFYFVKFDFPILMPAGKFYIGWEQATSFPLNVGFDMNYQVNGIPAKNPDMWYKIRDGIWGKTDFEGALMMRPIVGKWIEPTVGFAETKQQTSEAFNVSMYPNPATDFLYFHSSSTNDFTIEVFDLVGNKLASNVHFEKSINLQHLTSGLYLVTIKDTQTQLQQTKKLLINK
jgi:hypothetical protein